MSTASNEAVLYVLARMISNGRLAYIIGPGSQCFDMLVTAAAAITGETVDTFRDRYTASLRPIRPHEHALAGALDDLLDAMSNSECAEPGRKYAPEAITATAAGHAEAVLQQYRSENA